MCVHVHQYPVNLLQDLKMRTTSLVLPRLGVLAQHDCAAATGAGVWERRSVMCACARCIRRACTAARRRVGAAPARPPSPASQAWFVTLYSHWLVAAVA